MLSTPPLIDAYAAALDLGAWLAHGLDPVLFAEQRLQWEADSWQAQALRSRSRQIALNCARQSGKSTSTAVVALHTAIYEAPALVLLVSPSHRQSREGFGKVMAFLRHLEPAEELIEDNRLSAILRNGSRIVSLPGGAKTIRGYSGPALIIEDEAAYVSDEVHVAIRPMLAVSRGRLILMSTPNGRRGHFYDIWSSGDDSWERIQILGREVPRITPEFLDEERRALGPMIFSQEYEGQFIDGEASAFSSELIELALSNDFERFAA